MAAKEDERLYLIIGLVVIAGMVSGIFYGLNKLYDWATGNAELEVTVAAGFQADPPAPEKKFLHINGSVWLKDVPAQSGVVWVAVVRQDPPLKITFPAKIESGRFTLGPESALRAINDEDIVDISVRAAVSMAEGETAVGSAKARYGGRQTFDIPWYAWVAAVVVLFLFFAVIYTGNPTTIKNRLQVIAAYVVIVFALILPISAPFALSAYPAFMKLVATSPVSILKVRGVETTEGEVVKLNQWAFNIGGVPKPEEKTKDTLQFYDLQGGIVVPLYVIILALLGGAVNMTRAVPRLQNDLDAVFYSHSLEVASLSLEMTEKLAAGIGRRVIGGTQGEPRNVESASPEAGTGEREDSREITASDSTLDSVETSGTENHSSEEGGKERGDDLEKKLIGLRRDLIVQYMYLVTAPVLAIVVYYLLFMMEKRLIHSVPIVVLMAFASGLLAETVLGTIAAKAEVILQKVKTDSENTLEKLKKPPSKT